jgi:hypothetical protein
MNIKARAIAAILFTPLVAFSQNETSVIQGTIYGPEGEVIPYIPIQATETESAIFKRAESTKSGKYTLTDLAAGSYTITIATPCCAYMSYESDAIEIAAGETREFEIHLEEGSSFNTVGDDPANIAAMIRSAAVIPDEPPPRAADGKPDLSGVWLIGDDPFPAEVDAYPWAQELFDERAANEAIDHPHLRCLPGNPPTGGGTAPFIAKFVQKPSLLIILLEDYPGFRQVFMDGREHPEDPNPSWMGHSIGRWEGDTLVVDTVGFNDRGWISLYPRTEELRMVERYTRLDFGRIDLKITYEDPAVYKSPLEENLLLHLAPQEELIEYVCENNKWADVSGK